MNKRIAAAALAVLTVLPLASCQSTKEERGPRWYGAIVTSPHTRSATLLGQSTGPYTVKCSGTADDLTVDVSAPDGWSAVFRSPREEWTLRKTRTGEVARLTGTPDAISYLKYNDYIVDSESFTNAPRSWGLDDPLVRINMYVDCRPPQKRVGPPRTPSRTSAPTESVLPPPKGPEKGNGQP